MTGRFLLDSNIVIALFADDTGLRVRLSEATDVFISIIVLGELYYGAHKSRQTERNIERLDEFAAKSTVIACDVAIARRYGQVKDRLRKKGHPIPENDIWIAAVALEYQLTLITRDEHFHQVDDLAIQAW